jgi:hypothetical protein
MLGNFRGLTFGRFLQGVVAQRAMTGDPERFRARVRDVPDVGPTVNRTAADVGGVPEWALALSLIDRDPQARELSNCLRGLASRGSGRALLVIVPGVYSDQHAYFLARCVKWDLRESIKREWNSLGHVKWSVGDSISEVIEKIGALMHDANARDVASLNRLLEQDRRCVCLYHVIEGAHWKHDQGRTALKEWGRMFTKKQLALGAEQFLIAFLGIAFSSSTDADTELQQIASDWHDAENPMVDAGGPLIFVTPRLDKVRVLRTDVENWTAEASRRMGRSLELQFREEIRQMFAPAHDRDMGQTMEEIVRVLEAPLRREFELGPRVVDPRSWL